MIRHMATLATLAASVVTAVPAAAQGATNGYGYQNGDRGGIGSGATWNGGNNGIGSGATWNGGNNGIGSGATSNGYPGQGYPGGSYGGGYRGGSNSNVQSTRCESKHGQNNRCALDTSRGVVLTKQHGDNPCIEGRSWGYDRGGVWVSNGCRGSFLSGGGGGGGNGGGYAGGGYPGNGGGYPGGGSGRLVVCESWKFKPARCSFDVYRRADLVEVLGGDCTQGRSWGWDRGGIWVNNGCRARFRVN